MAPIVKLFFVLAGAKTDLTIFVGEIGGIIILLTLLYFSGRTLGKVVGAGLGGSLTASESNAKKYLGMCLLSQASVALGLNVSMETEFAILGGEAVMFGTVILSIVAISAMFLEIVGHVVAKWSLGQAREVGERKEDCITYVPIEHLHQGELDKGYELF